jgi:uncharacterized protein (TIGR02246 family)
MINEREETYTTAKLLMREDHSMKIHLWLAVPAVICLLVPLRTTADEPTGDPKDKEAIGKIVDSFADTFNKGDVKELTAYWAPNAEYLNSAGIRVSGRDEIGKLLEKFFAENKDVKVRVDSESLRFVSPDVAMEDGVRETFVPDGVPNRVRYTNIYVKKDGHWLLSSVRDTAYTPPSNYEQLRALEWATGEWASDNPKGEVERISLAFTETRNFIIGSFSTTIKDVSVGSLEVRIGWDPKNKQLRSWSFDDTGAFGEGTWTKEGDDWIIKSSLLLQDGKQTTATLVIKQVDANTMSLQIKDHTLDGNALPGSKEVKLKRVG